MEISVKNQRVLITAAASGIGCAVAGSFLENGASMILFLCSEAGSKISGQALSVDGFTETLRG